VSQAFNPAQGLIVVPVQIWGPTGRTIARLALDTGATGTTINTAVLLTTGCDPSVATRHVRITMGNGVVESPRVLVDRIDALGQDRRNFEVVAHTLPPSASVDGLLGLDFLRGQELTIDFRAGQITLR
jgi:predicted aspartyl protease